MEISPTSTNNTPDTNLPLTPDDDYWKKNTWKNFHNTNEDFNIFAQSLDKKDEMVLSVIDSLFGSIYVSINFSSKRLGFDEIFRCYTDEKNKQKILEEGSLEYGSNDNNDNDNNSYVAESNIFNQYVQGIQSFAGFPCGIICYHKCNEMLFQLCSVSLMLNYTCIPNQFIKEFNSKMCATDRDCLFITKRSSGKRQHCILNTNTSIVYNKKCNKEYTYWIVYIVFDDYHDYLTESDLEKQENIIINTRTGTLTKTVELGDFLNYNLINTLTFEKSKYLTSLKKSLIELSIMKVQKMKYLYSHHLMDLREIQMKHIIINISNIFMRMLRNIS